MSNYNSTLQSNNTDLQAILNTINELPEAGGSDSILQDKTVSPTTNQQIITADSGYDGLYTVTVNAMPTATQATPSIAINSSGLITATATQTAGYVSASTKSATKQLAFQAAKTITPTTTSQIAVSSGCYTGGNVMVAGDSNLVAGNIKSGVSIFGVSGNYEGSGVGSGDTSVEDGFVTKTLTNYTNDRVKTIGSYAFYNCTNLTSVSFPVCTNIGSYAFYNCSNLSSISFPSCKSLYTYAFYNCTNLTSASFSVCTNISNGAFCDCSNLTSVSFPVCTNIGSYAFSNCSSLTSASFPVCTNIGSSAFYYCSSLSSISFPSCTNIGSVAFYYCTNLTSASFPVCTNIGGHAFCGCSSLSSISLPACTNINGFAFVGCSSLTSISFPARTNIGSFVFCRCTKLSKIYLTASLVCSLTNSNAFSETSIWSNKGSIFVPSSLVASYKTATNWAFFSNRIFSVAPATITFTIDGTTYQAEEGMTWSEWCESSYNTNQGYTVSSWDGVSGTVMNSAGSSTVYYNGTAVSISEAVISNANYTLQGASGPGGGMP